MKRVCLAQQQQQQWREEGTRRTTVRKKIECSLINDVFGCLFKFNGREEKMEMREGGREEFTKIERREETASSAT